MKPAHPKLAPCLCGQVPVVMAGPGKGGTIVCKNCGLGYDRLGASCSLEAQVERWNTRPPSKEVEELRAAAQEVVDAEDGEWDLSEGLEKAIRNSVHRCGAANASLRQALEALKPAQGEGAGA